jgi:hypothetical protein
MLDAPANLPAPKQPTPVEVPTNCSIILVLNYGGHEQKDLAIFICRVENLLKFDAAVYPTEMD